jgi:hypothetical protein
MNLLLKRRCVESRRLIATSTLCVLAGLVWLAWFRQPTSAKAEHSLPPVIRLDIDSNDNAVVPGCQTITDYLNHAAHPHARTSWRSWASGNECEALTIEWHRRTSLSSITSITCWSAKMVSFAFVS